jgi:hypothetical protein
MTLLRFFPEFDQEKPDNKKHERRLRETPQ